MKLTHPGKILMKLVKPILTIIIVAAFALWVIHESGSPAIDNKPAMEKEAEKAPASPLMLMSVIKKGEESGISELAKGLKEFSIDTIDIVASPAPEKDITAVKPAENIAKLPENKPTQNPAAKEADIYETIVAKVTAYCPCARCCGSFANGRTSTKTNAWRPGIASDPSVIPYGTEITVPGYGTAKVDDTGSAMRKSWRNESIIHLDIRFQYHWQARNWGTKIMRLKIKRPETSTFSTR